jgi:hypothetical protein
VWSGLTECLSSKSLWTALFASYGGPFAFAACLKLLQDSLAFLQPQLLRLFLSFISSYQSARLSGISDHLAPSAVEGISIATIMFLTAMVQSIILHQVRVHFEKFPLFVDICFSIFSVASRLACAFVQALSQ